MSKNLKKISQLTTLATGLFLATLGNAERSQAELQAEMQRLGKEMAEIAKQLNQAGGQSQFAFHFGSDDAPRAVLGVVLGEADGKALVQAVTPSSGAADAGLKSGDELIAIDGKVVTSAQAAREALSQLKVDQSVQVKFKRAGAEQTASVKAKNRMPMVMAFGHADGKPLNLESLGNLESLALDDKQIEMIRQRAQAAGGDVQIRMLKSDGLRNQLRQLAGAGFSDLDLAAVNADLGSYFGATQGALVINATEWAPLLSGDVIQRVGDQTISTPAQALDALDGIEVGKEVAVRVLRQKQIVDLKVKVPARAEPKIIRSFSLK
jgi:S1-C subfamily serine protease